MYIIVKQLSNPIPTKNLQTQKLQKFPTAAVDTPPMKLTRFAPKSAGILPYLSANQPNNNPPMIAPTKKIACAI